jgi:hypothetical protein
LEEQIFHNFEENIFRVYQKKEPHEWENMSSALCVQKLIQTDLVLFKKICLDILDYGTEALFKVYLKLF